MNHKIETNEDYEYASDEFGHLEEEPDDVSTCNINNDNDYDDYQINDNSCQKRKEKTQAEIDREIVEEFYNNPTSSNFTNIWKRFYFGVHSYAARIIGDWEKSDDIVSETFMRAWNNKEMFDRSKIYSTWLYTICKNLCMTAMKSERNCCLDIDLNDIVDSIYQGDNPQEINSTPDNYYDVDENGNIITNSYEVITKRMYDTSLMKISTMEPMFKTIVDMKLNQGLTFKEIGETLGIKEHDAKNTYYYNLKRLAKNIIRKNNNLYKMYLDVNQDKELNELEYNSYIDSTPYDETDIIYIFD